MTEATGDVSTLPVWLQIAFAVGTVIAASVSGIWLTIRNHKNEEVSPRVFRSTQIAELIATLNRIAESNEKILRIMQDDFVAANMKRAAQEAVREADRLHHREDGD